MKGAQSNSEWQEENQSPSSFSPFRKKVNSSFFEQYDKNKLFLGLKNHLASLFILMFLGFILGALGTYHYLSNYKAETILFFQDDSPKTISDNYIFTHVTLSTLLDTIKLPSNLQEVRSILGLDLDIKTLGKMIEVPKPKSNSNLLRIIAKGDNRHLAIDIANTLAKVVVKNSQNFHQKQLQASLDNFELQLDSVLQKQLQSNKIINTKQLSEVKFLTEAIESTQFLINFPKSSLGFFQMAEKATVLKDSFYVKLLPLFGLLFGLVLGVVWGLYQEVRDDRLCTAKQVELNYTIPCLQVIPEIPFLNKRNGEEKTLFYIRNLAESIEILSKGINLPNRKGLLVTLTSSIANEGKSLLAYYLARYYQTLGKKAAFLEFDHKKNPFAEEPSAFFPKIETYLRNKASLEDIIIYGKPDMASIGSLESGMKELIKSSNMENLIAKLKNSYDIVIIDAPGIIEESYGINLAAYSHLTLFVVGSSIVTKNLIDESLLALSNYGVLPAGIILNKVPSVFLFDERAKLEAKRSRQYRNKG